MASADLTLVRGAAVSVRVGPILRDTSRTSSAAKVWARRKRRQWILGAAIGVMLLGAQAYGWLFLLGVV